MCYQRASTQCSRRKTRYTIRTLQHLADQLSGRPRADGRDRAGAEHPGEIPDRDPLELVRAGLVASTRGRDGGYSLALAPIDIRYGDIVRITRGSLALTPCTSRYAHEHCENCLPEKECRLRALMLKVRDEMAAVLDGITLADPIHDGGRNSRLKNEAQVEPLRANPRSSPVRRRRPAVPAPHAAPADRPHPARHR